MDRIRPLAPAVALAALTACVLPGSFHGPSGSHEIEGSVMDDGGDLPGGRNAGLAGVRIDVVDGPKAGAFVMSDATGKYRLPAALGDGPITLKATKSGFDEQTETFYPEYLTGPFFKLGQPPHVLWGDVVLARTTPSVIAPQVRLEIVDGPNAGKIATSDDTGRYWFGDLVASPSFSLRLTKAGHQTRTYGMTALWHNQQRNVQIEAE
jgi:hypothetical protein